MDWLLDVLNYILSFLMLIVLFFLAIPPRCSKWISWSIIGVFSGIMCAAFFVASAAFPGVAAGVLSLLLFTIPSFTMCLCLAKYRGFRFVFTFCSIDIFGIISVLFSAVISHFSKNAVLGLLLNLVFYAILFGVVMKFRPFYQKQLDDPQKGWGSMALVSILFYLLFYTLTAFPKPIVQRTEYIPVVLFYCCTVIAVYIVLFQTIDRMQKIQRSEQNQELLKTQLELQRSQLELQNLYYKLAYIDKLTGLKNRTAFEERRKALEENPQAAVPLWCATFDINNLKQTNDTLGHDAGDRLICKTAQALTDAVDGFGEVYRTGGDEFVVFAAQATQAQSEQCLKRLHSLLDERNSQGGIEVSLASGWSFLKDALTDTPQAVLLRADRNMYQNKREMKKMEA